MEHLEVNTRAVDRLTLFSDAVVAIAITLLAIDLPVPEGREVSQFLSSVRHNGSHYLAFLKYAWVMWIVVPLLVSQWRRRRRRHRASPETS